VSVSKRSLRQLLYHSIGLFAVGLGEVENKMDWKLGVYIYGSRPPGVTSEHVQRPSLTRGELWFTCFDHFDGLLVLSEGKISEVAGKVRVCTIEVVMGLMTIERW
jgi:hypothetical protein